MLNKVMIIGRLGQNPEKRYTSSGEPVTTFSVATSEFSRDKEGNRQEKTEWHRIVVFGKSAESCSTYLAKGSLAYIEGRLQTNKWQDKQGNDRYTTEIIANNVRFLDKKGENSEQNSYSAQNQYYKEDQYNNNNNNNNNKQASQANNNNSKEDDYGSPFPSEASSLDDMPF